MHRPVAIKSGDTDLALFRDDQGCVRALLDQCAHRRAPLSLGTVTVAGHVQCPYHGWRYEGAEGRCTAIPNLSSEEKVPRTYRVPAFAIAEQDGFIHIWSEGDATPAVPAPRLPVPALGVDRRESALLAYPHGALIDLMLDAPDAVLDIGGIAIVNAHRLGDPFLTDGMIEVIYAAIPASRRGKGLTSEYPFRVALRVPRDGGSAEVRLLDDLGIVQAAAVIGFMPVKQTLCTVVVQASSLPVVEGRRPITIGVRRAIDPVIARDAIDYVSRLRR
jgi:nitrite reductase/ring-hydroxylating ferredoxin subunit